jgi:hypothetical protein
MSLLIRCRDCEILVEVMIFQIAEMMKDVSKLIEGLAGLREPIQARPGLRGDQLKKLIKKLVDLIQRSDTARDALQEFFEGFPDILEEITSDELEQIRDRLRERNQEVTDSELLAEVMARLRARRLLEAMDSFLNEHCLYQDSKKVPGNYSYPKRMNKQTGADFARRRPPLGRDVHGIPTF